MARGWESKAIEAQVEDKAREGRRGPSRALTAEERTRLERRRALELARARTVADLARSTARAHRQMLEQALGALDRELAALEGVEGAAPAAP